MPKKAGGGTHARARDPKETCCRSLSSGSSSRCHDTTSVESMQVGGQEVVNNLNSHETIPDIDGMTLEDNKLDGGYIHKIGNSPQHDSSHENERLEDSGSKGSPSNNFSDVLIPKSKVNESSTKTVVGETDDSLNQSQKQKPATKKPVVRAKVPFEKGYSQMDWLKLTRTEPDLAGLRGQSNRRLISMDEVRQHKTEGSIWTVLKGRVYNISPYMKFHPGGVDMLMKAAGKDCTALFNKYHAWVNAEFLLEKCLVGVMDDS